VKALPGATASVSLTVAHADTAPAAGSGDVPVLATPRLLALCEQAAVAAVAPSLEKGATTVGCRVELEHLAPSFPGAVVQATAVLTRVEGSRLTFAVTARQGGRVVARGTIERVVVDRARFLAHADPRATGDSTPGPG
jgi:fluoroacetyl-CoA thioesterase